MTSVYNFEICNANAYASHETLFVERKVSNKILKDSLKHSYDVWEGVY